MCYVVNTWMKCSSYVEVECKLGVSGRSAIVGYIEVECKLGGVRRHIITHDKDENGCCVLTSRPLYFNWPLGTNVRQNGIIVFVQVSSESA